MASDKVLEETTEQMFCEHLDQRAVVIGSQCASTRDALYLT